MQQFVKKNIFYIFEINMNENLQKNEKIVKKKVSILFSKFKLY